MCQTLREKKSEKDIVYKMRKRINRERLREEKVKKRKEKQMKRLWGAKGKGLFISLFTH